MMVYSFNNLYEGRTQIPVIIHVQSKVWHVNYVNATTQVNDCILPRLP